MRDLYQFVLARQIVGGGDWKKVGDALFVDGGAILFGEWDHLSARRVPRRAQDGSNPGLPERRITYAFGPVWASQVQWKENFAQVGEQYPCVAYVEVRLQDWLLWQKGVGAVDAAAELIHRRLTGVSPHAIFLSLGHSDLIVCLFADSAARFADALFQLRSLLLKDLGDGTDLENHLVQATYSTFGFFGVSHEDLRQVPERLADADGAVHPTVLINVFPGHEQALAEIADLVRDPHGRIHLRIECITGEFDLRLSIEQSAVEPQPPACERDVFRWLIDFYLRLFNGAAGAEHVAHIHTVWGESISGPRGRKLIRAFRSHTLPVAYGPYRVDEPYEALRKRMGPRWVVLRDLVERYNALVALAPFATYIADVGAFLGAFIRHLNSEPTKLSAEAVEFMLRRVALLLGARTAGALPVGHPGVTFTSTVGLQKVSLACAAAAREVAACFGGPPGAKLLVGTTFIGTARSTRIPSGGLALIEVPAMPEQDESLRFAAYTLAHEVAHLIGWTEEDAREMREALLGEVAATFARGLQEAWIYGPEGKHVVRLVETVIPAAELLDLLRAHIAAARVNDPIEAFNLHLHLLGKGSYLFRLLSELLRKRGVSRLAYIPHEDMLALERIARRIARHLRNVEYLGNECRADIIAASIAGWKRYLDELPDWIGAQHALPRGMDPALVKDRLAILTMVSRRNTMPATSNVAEAPYNHLVHVLGRFADRVDAQTRTERNGKLALVCSLMDELAQHSGEVSEKLVRCILDLWTREVGRLASQEKPR